MLNDPRSVNSRQSSDQHLEMRRTTSVLVHTRGRTHAPVRRHVRTYVVAGIACTWLQRVCLYQYTRVSFACLRLCCGRCQLTTIIPSPCPLHPLPLHPRGRSQCLFADVQILLFTKHSCQIRRTLHALAEATHTLTLAHTRGYGQKIDVFLSPVQPRPNTRVFVCKHARGLITVYLIYDGRWKQYMWQV